MISQEPVSIANIHQTILNLKNVKNMADSYIPKLSLIKEQSDYKSVKINSPISGAEYCRQFFASDLLIYESFFILLLNAANHTIGYAKISQGGCVGTVVDVKIIAKYCVDSLAGGVILCHNHPSGNTQPSKSDIEITDLVKKTLRLFNCDVIDHIILTESDFLSFANEGLLLSPNIKEDENDD